MLAEKNSLGYSSFMIRCRFDIQFIIYSISYNDASSHYGMKFDLIGLAILDAILGDDFRQISGSLGNFLRSVNLSRRKVETSD